MMTSCAWCLSSSVAIWESFWGRITEIQISRHSKGKKII
jgi:hypothetical protein